MGYKYYDTPEGHDCFKKLWRTTKLATGIGLVVATQDVLLYSHPKGYYQTLARYGYYTVPFIGMAAAFSSTVCVATNLRNKDDYLNYILGGFAAGSIFGTWRKSIYTGIRASAVLGFAALIKKSFVENNWKMYRDDTLPYRRVVGSLWGSQNDFTLSRDPALKDK